MLNDVEPPPRALPWYSASPMTSGKPEQRSLPRVPVQVQVSIRSGQSEPSTGLTRDLSRNGVFFYTDSQIHEGSDLEMVLMLPPELTQGEKSWVCCQASVVRVEATPGAGQVGVAANIRSIATLPEIPGESAKSR
jgi:hypothetical protein